MLKDSLQLKRFNQIYKLIKVTFMFCTSQNAQFIEKILHMTSKQVNQVLESEDQKYITRKKQQAIRNMPEILKPNLNEQSQTQNFIKNFINTNFSNKKKSTEEKKNHFPSSFEQKSRNHLLMTKSKGLTQNTPQNYQNYLPKVNNSPFTFQTGIKGQFSSWKGQKLSDKFEQNVLLSSEVKTMKIQENEQKMQGEIKFDTENELSFKKFQKQLEKQVKDEKFLTQQVLKQQENSKTKIENPFAPPQFQQSKNSPFISNKTNFLDLHTNKKTNVGNYLSPQVYSMNMMQYAQNKKRQNTFDDRYSYPNIIMGGSGNGWMKTAQQMRENPFQKTFVSGSKGFGDSNNAHYQSGIINQAGNYIKAQANNRFRQNVQDTLKYTLGDRRYTATIPERNNEGRMIDNYRTNGFQGLTKKQAPQNRTKVLQNPFVRRPASTYKN